MLPAIATHLGGLSRGDRDRLVDSLSEDELVAVLSDWDLWSLPYQRLPPGNWRRVLMRCGRGVGKTFAGARNTNEVARDRKKIKSGEIGIIGRTHDDARFTMVEGSSGILATAPPDFRPRWEPGNKLLTWPNGVKGRIFSADKPEGLRGPNWSWVWGDEPAFWPDLEELWWTVINPAIRTGWARAMLTTTPIRDPALRRIEEHNGTVVRTAVTYDNPYLSDEIKADYHEQYDGTNIGKQEMYGEYLDDAEFALWDHDMIDAYRVKTALLPFRRVVIAVDPAVSANENSDETGIVVVGKGDDGHAYPVQDRSLKGSPAEWGRRAVAAYHRWDADVIVAEVNNGGDLVESNIRAIDERVNVKKVRASRGKVVRAEPVVALYERGLVHHVGTLEQLEEQMTTWEPSRSQGRRKLKSPDRLDALVWGLWELYLDERHTGPARAYL